METLIFIKALCRQNTLKFKETQTTSTKNIDKFIGFALYFAFRVDVRGIQQKIAQNNRLPMKERKTAVELFNPKELKYFYEHTGDRDFEDGLRAVTSEYYSNQPSNGRKYRFGYRSNTAMLISAEMDED
jgi:hypothetical protein